MSVKVVEVEIKVGIASVADGVFKARRGKRLRHSEIFCCGKEEITRKAVEKLSSFDQAFEMRDVSFLLSVQHFVCNKIFCLQHFL